MVVDPFLSFRISSRLAKFLDYRLHRLFSIFSNSVSPFKQVPCQTELAHGKTPLEPFFLLMVKYPEKNKQGKNIDQRTDPASNIHCLCLILFLFHLYLAGNAIRRSSCWDPRCCIGGSPNTVLFDTMISRCAKCSKVFVIAQTILLRYGLN